MTVMNPSRPATATAAATPGRRAARVLRRLREPLVSATVFGLAILGWEVGVRVTGTPDYALPAPSLIVSTADWAGVLTAARDTVGSVLMGFAAGNAAGLLLALLISASPLLAAVLYPLALTVRAVPVVALAPFITLVAGRGAAPTVVVAALIVFFPTLVNVLLGLRSVEREALELMHVLNCRARTVYWRVRLPAAMPAFFDSLRIAAPSAVLGVMTAEWLIGGDGLGKLVISTALSQDTATMWGAILASSAVAGLVYAAITLAERRLLPWAVRR
ncbi:NitT/TauT family transport system permease protein [Actinocorallia herbida]|uniref:NitT/TauT family transport system permease protein n=2 Tax=Actinocorallia herbida TaxID=58109 RepID=A0A3N1D147_9ACTN|nr:NitT/TauT family transport system permease protein [Actinocorallia herbida]